mgnify:CR=1 FL=1
MTYSTHTIHLEPTDSLTIDRRYGTCLGLTVSDDDGRTVARVEFLGRPDQLDAVALAPAGQAVRA